MSMPLVYAHACCNNHTRLIIFAREGQAVACPKQYSDQYLEVLLQPLPQRVGDLVETHELADTQHLRVVAGSAGVQPLDDGAHVTEDARVHQGCKSGTTRRLENTLQNFHGSSGVVYTHSRPA